jgi:hypothetical protein
LLWQQAKTFVVIDKQIKKTDSNHLAVLVLNNLYYTSNKESSPNPVLVKTKFIVGPGFLATSLRKPFLSCRFRWSFHLQGANLTPTLFLT